jgi:glycosyltransferase involved in cell wall biosynthesis
MRHALFVVFHFPPEASSSGVLRSLKYARYLEEHGWRVTAITPAATAYAVVDPTLERQLPASCRVVRTNYLNTKRHLSIAGRYPALLALPDTWAGWLPWGVAAGRRVLEADPFDLVYSTSPHATAHLIARRLARKSGRPWVTDFRDPWFEEPAEPGAPDGFVFRAIDRRLERGVIEDCSAVVTSTVELRELLRTRYAGLPREKFIAILNGYDEADFAEAPPTRADRGERFTIVHAGSVNGDFRDPRPLFAALQRCIGAGTVDPARTRLRLVGGGPFADSPALREAVDRMGLRSVVEVLPRVPYAQSLQELANADLLLLLQASPDTASLVPAKLYEYLRSQRPVLALVHAGATSEVLGLTGGGWAVAPEDEQGLARTLAEAFAKWRDRSLPRFAADLAVLRRFDRKALAGELAKLFDRLAA